MEGISHASFQQKNYLQRVPRPAFVLPKPEPVYRG